MERCPCCKARLGGASLCPRCQADLSKVIEAGQAARYWLTKALTFWQAHQTVQCLNALDLSLHHKQSGTALALRDFVIQQECREIIDLLAQKQLHPARQRLYSMRFFRSHSKLLQELNEFTDFLSAKPQSRPLSFEIQKKFHWLSDHFHALKQNLEPSECGPILSQVLQHIKNWQKAYPGSSAPLQR